MNKENGIITRVTGPLVKAKGLFGAKMYEVVKVSEEGLLGEIIELDGDIASIQVYEETGGIGPGEKVERTGATMSVELGPGLLESIYDGIQRPLSTIEEKSKSHFIARGIEAYGLDREREWEVVSKMKVGESVVEGDIIATVQETSLIEHRIMVPPGVSGELATIANGPLKVEDLVATVKTKNGIAEIPLMQKWSVRRPRPSLGKIFPNEPLVTGGRSIDTFFPIAKGGAGCIPGPFGAGKTVTQQTIAKYCNAEIIVYIGCGERGNEMTEVLSEFPHLIDPNTGESLMKRTILIANTSNMPVAAREASIYTGVTIAEYYRDMGYSVALMADSTSRWAEAMREISGRLEEMPGEEGYPAYLSSRTASFYERAGKVKCLGSDNREGALTVIGAVSPPGGDLSEPVSQATLRVTKAFWGLDADLAYRKHFPSINWLNSYSLYVENLKDYWKEHVAPDFIDIRAKALQILQKESKLMEIVRLVGQESLSNSDKLVLEIAKSLREDYLFQNAFDKEDAYTSPKRQYGILKTIVVLYEEASRQMSDPESDFKKFRELPVVAELSGLKNISDNELEKFEAFQERIRQEIKTL